MSRSRFNPAGLLGGWLWIALLTPGGTMALAAPGPAAIGTKAAVVDPLDFAGRIARLGDAQGLPFIIVDKVGARAFVFGADGALLGSAPVLLGAARGDDNPPGIGTMRLADIRPEQRITPAGRFEARLGATLGPRDVLWIDYDSALSLHRVVTNKPAERRAQRLASTSPADNRISYGCINVAVDFYESVVQPLFKPAGGIVYILPETRPAAEFFSWAASSEADDREAIGSSF